jgi:hypothetical protein
MLTKSDLQAAIAAAINNYPDVAPLYQVGDPRIIQHLDAMATMHAMLSAQIEIAQAEPFEKVRDATVLADAAMRGIIRKARPGRVRVTATNNNGTSFNVETGRVILDSVGNPYRIETAATAAANGGTATFEAVQLRTETLTHTVANSAPFYDILIPEATDESYLSGISVSDGVGAYTYRERYINTSVGEKVFNIEADDRQNVYVRFGYDGVVGYQPPDGTVITLEITRSVGRIAPKPDSPFTFEYILHPNDANVDLVIDAVLDSGQSPPDMTTLRDMIKYPSIYDHDAVFLGEFEFRVRRSYGDAQFLSVWNEYIEEVARGPDLENINALFVAVLSRDGGETVLTEPDPNMPVAPTEIAENALTGVQIAIRELIKNADDSYRVRFFTPVRSEISMTINATVSTAYVATDVTSQIREAILDAYGEEAAASRKGGSRPLYKHVYDLLKKRVPAIADQDADMQVTIEALVGDFRPELWRYVAPGSLTVTVQTASLVQPSWG